MNTILRCVLFACFACFAGCDAGHPPAQRPPPVPNESATFKALSDIRKSIESSAPDKLAWQGPIAGGGGGGSSAGEGKWHADNLFMIHGNDESAHLLLRGLRDELRSKIELTGAQLNAPDESVNGVGRDAFQLVYTIGKHKGTVSARLKPAPENAHKLVPGGQQPTHQLTIEIAETFKPGSGG